MKRKNKTTKYILASLFYSSHKQKINIRLKEKRQKLSGKNKVKNKVKIEWYKKSKIIKKSIAKLKYK